jgi:DEAD/DEAH box helicase domain-containing protein
MDMFSIFDEDKEVVRRAYFDLETQRRADAVGWENKDLMFISIAVCYMEPENEYRVYGEGQLPIEQLVEDLRDRDEVVGYNVVNFDRDVLTYYADTDLYEVNWVDMMMDINSCLNRRLSIGLDNVASATLGLGKTAKGIMALEWWEKFQETGDYDWVQKIIDYCKGDVDVTRDVHKYGLSHGQIYFLNRNEKKTPVNISYRVRHAEDEDV